MTERVTIPQGRYLWAIKRAGSTIDDYAEAHPKVPIREWVDGGKLPTVKQLEAFANSVNVPFGFLFLDDEPSESVPIPFFRGDAGSRWRFDLDVYDAVINIKRRQEWLEEYLSENDIEQCRLVGSVSASTKVAEAVSLLHEFLCLDEGWRSGLASAEAGVAEFTRALEQAGVFVAYNGVVGNNTHRPLKVSECRGFSLVSEFAPYIFVNSADAPTAQLFTLAHEAAHLMLGVSAGHGEADTPATDDTERYCDAVAAEFLVPSSELQSSWTGDIKLSARKFLVSEVVIARRAHDLGLMSDDSYKSFWDDYSRRPKPMRKRGSGGSFYRTSVKRVGLTFAIHVRNAVASRQLSYTDAFRLTGLHGKTYYHFMNVVI